MAGTSGDFTLLEHRSVGVLYFISGVLGILGNLIIILIFWREKPLSGNRNVLHINLAIANIMIVAGTPFSGSSAFSGRWLYGDVGCQLYGLETYTGGIGAVSFSCLICVQRALASTSSISYSSSGWSGVLCCLGWLYSLVIAVGPLVGWNSYVIESSGTACGLKWRDLSESDQSLFLVLVVATTIMTAVALLALRAAFHAGSNSSTSNDWFTDKQLNWIAVSNLTIVTLGFGPYGFFATLALLNQTSNMTMLASVIPPMVAKLSTAFYPIPYLLASQKFRKAFSARTIGGCTEGKDE